MVERSWEVFEGVVQREEKGVNQTNSEGKNIC